jgi:hypothetical protein
MEEMVGFQIAIQAAKPLKKGGKKRIIITSSGTIALQAVLVLTPLASSLVCVFLMYIGSPLVIA